MRKQICNFIFKVLKYNPEIINLELDLENSVNIDVFLYNLNRHDKDFNVCRDTLNDIVRTDTRFTYTKDGFKIKIK